MADMVTIIPELLTKRRKGRGLTQLSLINRIVDLARQARQNHPDQPHETVSVSTLSDIESNKAPTVKRSKAEAIAKALECDVAALEGHADFPADRENGLYDEWYPPLQSIRLDRKTHNAIWLACRRFAVPEDWLISMAPTMLEILAAQDLHRRASVLAELKARLDRVREIVGAHPHIGSRASVPSLEGEEIIAAEQRSIEKRDLFGRITLDADIEEDEPYDIADVAPFLCHLRNEAQRLGLQVDCDKDLSFPRLNIDYPEDPDGIIEALACNDSEIADKLRDGTLLIRDIPKSYLKKGMREKRLQWLRERAEAEMAKQPVVDLVDLDL